MNSSDPVKVFQPGDKVRFPVRIPNSERIHYREAVILMSWVGPFGSGQAEVLSDGDTLSDVYGTSRMELIAA